ncbi:MAG: YncE family protein [Proteobacteria bacterium]|nr:YncE family protein [Pseudomonadota bacterium]
MKDLIRCITPLLLGIAATAGAYAAEQPLAWPVVATIEVPHSAGKFDFLQVDSQRHRLLGAHEKDGTSDFFDLTKHTLIRRVKAGAAVDTAVDTDSRHYFVSVQEEQRVTVLDAATLRVLKTIKMPGPTDAIIYEPRNHRLYATHDEGNDVWVIDPATARIVATVAIPGVPEYMAYDPDADRIYLNIKDKDVVAVIDPNSDKVIAQWSTAPATLPHGLALNRVTHQIYAAGGKGKLVAIDTHTGARTASADIASGVDQIAFDEAGSLLYCAAGGRMSVLHAAAGKLEPMGELITAATAKNVAVDPQTHAIWTTYTDGKSSFAKGWSPPRQQ